MSWTDTMILWNLMGNLKKNLNSTSQTFCFPFCVLEPTKRGEGSRNFLEFRDPHKNVRQLTNEHHLTFMCYPSMFLFLNPNLKTKLKLHGVGVYFTLSPNFEKSTIYILIEFSEQIAGKTLCQDWCKQSLHFLQSLGDATNYQNDSLIDFVSDSQVGRLILFCL